MDITKNQFKKILNAHQENIKDLLVRSREIDSEITKSLEGLEFNDDEERR